MVQRLLYTWIFPSTIRINLTDLSLSGTIKCENCPKSPTKNKSLCLSALNIYMENAQLTIADMASLKGLLEAAANRGAFKAHEMSTVGAIYDKLSKFVEVTTAQLAEQQAQGEQNA
jgi:hypothetical protein